MYGGPGAWDNAQKSATQCTDAKCEGIEAAYYQVQIRSADEPMTSFYKVCFLFGGVKTGLWNWTEKEANVLGYSA